MMLFNLPGRTVEIRKLQEDRRLKFFYDAENGLRGGNRRICFFNLDERLGDRQSHGTLCREDSLKQ